MNWFPAYADGAILYAERRLREQPGSEQEAVRAIGQAADALLLVRERGLPRTSEAFDYALGLIERLKDRKELPAQTRRHLSSLEKSFQSVLAAYCPGGLFTSFSRLPLDITPERLWTNGAGTSARSARRRPAVA